MSASTQRLFAAKGRRQRRSGLRGQSLVEFAFLLPLFMLLLLGMLEFGLMFTHNQTLEYATREGARTGAALANGGGLQGCAKGQSPNKLTVDPQIIASVQRVLTSEGSPVKDNLNQVPTIRIYKATSTGTNSGFEDTWSYSKGGGPVVDGKALDFALSHTGWDACGRTYNPPADALGVSLTYTYNLETGLGAILRFLGGNGWTTVQMSDRTVMNINPTNLNITH